MVRERAEGGNKEGRETLDRRRKRASVVHVRAFVRVPACACTTSYASAGICRERNAVSCARRRAHGCKRALSQDMWETSICSYRPLWQQAACLLRRDDCRRTEVSPDRCRGWPALGQQHLGSRRRQARCWSSGSRRHGLTLLMSIKEHVDDDSAYWRGGPALPV